MELQVSYDVVKTKYSAQVAEVLARQAKGKSKQKDIAPEKLTWYFSWCVRLSVPLYSLQDVLTGKPKADVAKEKPETEASVTSNFKQNAKVCLCAKASNRAFWSSEVFSEIPEEVLAFSLAQWKTKKAEDEAYAALPQVEKTRLANEAIKQLYRGRGFFTIGCSKL